MVTIGYEVKELYPRSYRKCLEPVLEVKDLAGIAKPESAILTLHRGEVLGISGLIGSGCNELMRVIFGLDTVCNGEINVGAYIGPD
jgi:ribose transport system ATP-binding protein